MATVVTHTSPDWDAIASCWLLDRFSPLRSVEIAYVNTGTPDPAVLAAATAVVDTGKVYDPARLRFDHHQLPGAAANATCAAMQVYDSLHEEFGGMAKCWPLIELVHAGDTGKPTAKESRVSGIHALLSEWKAQKLPDQELMQRGYVLLNVIASYLGAHDLDTALAAALIPHADAIASYQERRAAAVATMDAHTVYRSADGLLLALDNAPLAASFAAFEAGAQIVVWHSDYPDVPTVAVGISRTFESAVHLGELVTAAEQRYGGTWSTLDAELARWFRHPAGFMAGRGTPKAPVNEPFVLDLASLAAMFDAVWER